MDFLLEIKKSFEYVCSYYGQSFLIESSCFIWNWIAFPLGRCNQQDSKNEYFFEVILWKNILYRVYQNNVVKTKTLILRIFFFTFFKFYFVTWKCSKRNSSHGLRKRLDGTTKLKNTKKSGLSTRLGSKSQGQGNPSMASWKRTGFHQQQRMAAVQPGSEPVGLRNLGLSRSKSVRKTPQVNQVFEKSHQKGMGWNAGWDGCQSGGYLVWSPPWCIDAEGGYIE